MMKKIIATMLLMCMTMCLLGGCGTKDSEITESDRIELTVFAAASLTESLSEIAKLYKAVAPEVTLVFNFDSSGTLKTQIEEGAECDVFISASPKQMDELDLIVQESRRNLLENQVSLAVPENNPKGIRSYEDLMKKLQEGTVLLAMGNADVPVGQYTQKILAYYGISEEALAEQGGITYGSNAKEVTTQVSEAVVDCGIIYGTDAYSAGLTVVDTATEAMCGRVLYPAAVLKNSQNQEAAEAFLDYLTGDEAAAVFEAVGFVPILE